MSIARYCGDADADDGTLLTVLLEWEEEEDIAVAAVGVVEDDGSRDIEDDDDDVRRDGIVDIQLDCLSQVKELCSRERERDEMIWSDGGNVT